MCAPILNDKSQEGPLPKCLFFQLGNIRRENKNRYTLSVLELLVRLSVFEDVTVSFLPVWYTHCDICQSFSATSNGLRHQDAVMMTYLHDHLSQCCNIHTLLSNLKEVANFSSLYDKTDCMNTINLLTKYPFFRFTRTQKERSGSDECDFISSGCELKCTAQETTNTLND